MRYLILALLFSITYPFHTFALSSTSDFSKTDMRNATLWRDYVYIPVLNVTLPQAPLAGDEFHAITVKNLGSAKAGREVKAVRVWRDDGDSVFDSRLDKELGEAVWDGVNSWDLSGIRERYGSDSASQNSMTMSIFVTIDTSSSITASTTIRFAIPQLQDVNGNGEKEDADEGVFLMSSNDGPSDGEIINGRTDTFSSASRCATNKLGPRTPSSFAVDRTGNSGELKLSWINPPDVDFFSIDAYRSINPDIIGNIAHQGVTNSSRIDVGLVDGTTYYYTVKAIDTCNNESLPTAAIAAVPSSEPLTPVEPPIDTSTTTDDGTTALAKGPSGIVSDGNKTSASSMPQTSANIQEGDLVRGEDGIKVYVAKNGYVRWVQSPAIMGMYGHFMWLNIKQVSNLDLNKFYESSLIRADGDDRVYKVDSEGKKHWLDITAQQFETEGYNWEAIYIINKMELDWYGTGAEIKI